MNAVISVSEYVRTRLVDLIGEDPPRYYTIYNGVDPSFFSPVKDLPAAQHALGLDGKFVILYVGRLASNKGLDCLIRSMVGVSREINNSTLLICGKGEMEERLRKETTALNLQDYISFRG
jgi:glycosyltransferase involved in cell wall biosynthesis